MAAEGIQGIGGQPPDNHEENLPNLAALDLSEGIIIPDYQPNAEFDNYLRGLCNQSTNIEGEVLYHLLTVELFRKPNPHQTVLDIIWNRIPGDPYTERLSAEVHRILAALRGNSSSDAKKFRNRMKLLLKNILWEHVSRISQIVQGPHQGPVI